MSARDPLPRSFPNKDCLRSELDTLCLSMVNKEIFSKFLGMGMCIRPESGASVYLDGYTSDDTCWPLGRN